MYQKYIKRLLDFLTSIGAIVILSPLMTVISVLIKIKHGKPILFKQKRPGKNEKLFILYKFRTMVNRRDKKGRLLPDELRLTRFGRWLRSTSLDELPELFNVVKGDMSMIGPRPLLIKYLPYYRKEERRRSSVKPGITGLAQVNGRNALSWGERFQLDLEYVSKLSFFTDLKIFIKTIVAVFQRKDILVGSEHVIQNLDIERRDEQIEKRKTEAAHREKQIHQINETELLINEDQFKELFTENLRINYPEQEDFGDYVNETFEKLLEYLEDGSAIVIGAFSDWELIGFLWAYQKELFGEQRIHLSQLVVSEKERNKGLGTKLIEYLEKVAISDHIYKIELMTSFENRNSIGFYAGKGFLVTRLQMEKDLRNHVD